METKCWNCGNRKYLNRASIEKCSDCGIRFDYGCGEPTEVYKTALARYHAANEARQEEEFEKWAEEHGYNTFYG